MGLIGILITTLFGTVLTFLFGGNYRKLERVSIGILFGFGFQTFFMFIFYLFGFRFTLSNTLIEVLLLMSAVLVVIIFVRSARVELFSFLDLRNIIMLFKKLKINFVKSNTLTKSIWILVLGLITSSFAIGVYFPVYGWDSLVLYDFRAFTFVATGGMEDGIARGYFFGYPLMTSLAHTWFYFLKSNPHLFYWSIYVGFLGISYFSLRPYLSRMTLMLTLLILASLSSFYSGSYFDYTNFPYNVYLIAGILYICRYLKEKQKSYLLLAAILTGFSTWVRQTEPFWLINIFTIVVLLFVEARRNILSFLMWTTASLGSFFLIQQPWRLFEAKNISGTNITDQAGYAFKSIQYFDWGKLLDVIITTTEKTIPTWQPYLLVAIFVSLFLRDHIKKAWIFLYFVLANILLLYFGTYIFSIVWQENWKDIVTSQQRLSSFISPLLIIYTTVIAHTYILEGLNFIEWAVVEIKKKLLD